MSEGREDVFYFWHWPPPVEELLPRGGRASAVGARAQRKGRLPHSPRQMHAVHGSHCLSQNKKTKQRTSESQKVKPGRTSQILTQRDLVNVFENSYSEGRGRAYDVAL